VDVGAQALESVDLVTKPHCHAPSGAAAKQAAGQLAICGKENAAERNSGTAFPKRDRAILAQPQPFPRAGIAVAPTFIAVERVNQATSGVR
jgi:hypothetical protein